MTLPSITDCFDLYRIICDPVDRLILADALEEEERLGEADCLRSGMAVRVYKGSDADSVHACNVALIAHGFPFTKKRYRAYVGPIFPSPISSSLTFHWELGCYTPHWSAAIRKFRHAQAKLMIWFRHPDVSRFDYDTGAPLTNPLPVCTIEFLSMSLKTKKRRATAMETLGSVEVLELFGNGPESADLQRLVDLYHEGWNHSYNLIYTRRQYEALVTFCDGVGWPKPATRGGMDSRYADYLHDCGLFQDGQHQAGVRRCTRGLPADVLTELVSLFTNDCKG